MKIKIVYFSIFLLFSCSTFRDTYKVCVFPEHSPFPGGLINKTIKISSSQISEVNIDGENIYSCQVSHDLWRILSPVGLLQKKDSVNIYHKERILLTIPLSKKDYGESRIIISDLDMISPPLEYLPRIQYESEVSKAAMNIISKKYHSFLKMTIPVEGERSSEFGVQRLINNEPRDRHTGLDIAAANGSQIFAPISGKVVLVGDFYYRGKTTFLDHGGGIISTYSHMSEISVTKGEVIKKNQIIGKVGKSGRVTGPHLHWQVVLYGTPVDPELFIEKNF